MVALLRVIEQRHEAKIHVQLLVAVEKCETRVIRNKIDVYLLKTAQHHNVLNDSSGICSGEIGQLKAMTMKVYGMNIVTGVAQLQAVAFTLLQVK